VIALSRPKCPNPTALVAGRYNDPKNKEALKESTSGKYMYCESKIEHISFAHVEHIKPKALDKFPELKFTWDNLGFCCHRCNTEKGSKYDENIPFINPYNENPEDYIVFIDHIIYPKQNSMRGKYTINELALNRSGLIDRRKEKIDRLKRMLQLAFKSSSETLRNQTIEQLKRDAEKDKEYSAAVKSLLFIQGIL